MAAVLTPACDGDGGRLRINAVFNQCRDRFQRVALRKSDDGDRIPVIADFEFATCAIARLRGCSSHGCDLTLKRAGLLDASKRAAQTRTEMGSYLAPYSPLEPRRLHPEAGFPFPALRNRLQLLIETLLREIHGVGDSGHRFKGDEVRIVGAALRRLTSAACRRSGRPDHNRAPVRVHHDVELLPFPL